MLQMGKLRQRTTKVLAQDQLHSQWKDRGPGLQTSCLGLLWLHTTSQRMGQKKRNELQNKGSSSPQEGLAWPNDGGVLPSSRHPRGVDYNVD